MQATAMITAIQVQIEMLAARYMMALSMGPGHIGNEVASRAVRIRARHLADLIGAVGLG